MAGIVYYKKTVPYTIIVRRDPTDVAGVSLNVVQEWVAVKEEDLRDFKVANRQHIIEGIIIETEEPNVDWVTPNQLTTKDMDELLGHYAKLKSALGSIDSLPIVGNLLERAKELNKPTKTISLISTRIEELSDLVASPEDMQGVYDS